MPTWPSDDRRTRIVFIGWMIDEDRIRSLLEAAENGSVAAGGVAGAQWPDALSARALTPSACPKERNRNDISTRQCACWFLRRHGRVRRCQLPCHRRRLGDDSFESTLNILAGRIKPGRERLRWPRRSAARNPASSSSAFAVSYSRDFGAGLDFSDRDDVQKRAVGGNFRDRNCIARLETAKFRDDASEGRTDGALRASGARVGEGGGGAANIRADTASGRPGVRRAEFRDVGFAHRSGRRPAQEEVAPTSGEVRCLRRPRRRTGRSAPTSGRAVRDGRRARVRRRRPCVRPRHRARGPARIRSASPGASGVDRFPRS